MEMDEDNHGYHFGAFQDNELVAVVSLFQDSTDFQFRKFAVINRLQKTGVGKTLLNYITGFAIAEGAKRIWCNARVSAVGFYLRYDFAQTGKVYSKGGIDYEIMEKDLKTEN
jgi:predicted GNAT family N-acyltransferase